MKVLGEERKPIKNWATDLEPEAEQQVRNLANLPFIHSHVAVMPDAHAGKGSTVGTVIATSGAIIPAAVGVDIGCGMMACKLDFNAGRLPSDLAPLRHSIERSVPVGFNSNKEVSERVSEAMGRIIAKNHRAMFDIKEKQVLQLGTLGGGNHFIELCIATDNSVWVVLHSGSRNIGKERAEIHIDKAKGVMKQHFISLPDPDLAYLSQGTPEFAAYLADLHFCQDFAMENRAEIMRRVLKDVSFFMYGSVNYPAVEDLMKNAINCHHNYTSMENHNGKNIWITRKGAVSARSGELGIIPGSMGTKSYIVRGLGNEESFCSCSHGAGRRMSRTKARQKYTASDLANQTVGVECRKDEGVVDEIPAAYKDIDQVMENQKDLVETVYELKQVLCIKG